MNFPNTPADGEYYYDTESGIRYQWVAAWSIWKFAGNTQTLLTAFNNKTEDYVLANTDAENMLEFTINDNPANRSMVNVYIPNDGEIVLQIGSGYNLFQKGNAKIRIVPNTGITFYSTGANSFPQNSVVTLLKHSANVWYGLGGLTT